METFKEALDFYTDFIDILRIYGVNRSTCETDLEKKQINITAHITDRDVEHIGQSTYYVYERLNGHSQILNNHFKIKSHVNYNDFFNIVNIAIAW